MDIGTQDLPSSKRASGAPEKPQVAQHKPGGAWRWIVALCVIAVAAYFLRGRFTSAHAGQPPAKGGKAGQGQGARAVPVVAVTAAKGNMNVYLTGLGTVTPLSTVTLHTRVDGELTKVAFKEGQLVNQGDLLAEIDPRPFQVMLEQAEGTMAKDDATLKNANIDLERYRVLLAQDSIPKQQLDTQVATVSQVEGSLKSDQAQIDNAKLQLVYSRITSPITGRIGLRLVDQGNIVHANDANGLAVITQLQPITVIFNIAEDSLSQVTKKLAAGRTLAVEAWDHDLKNKLTTGSLLTIDNQIDPSTGTLRFKAIFDNRDNALFPNQFVNARLLVDVRAGTVIVPSAAVQRSSQSTFVYVVQPDKTVQVRDIVTTLTEGDQSSIDSGLAAGDVVVIDGIDKLQQGAKVSVRLSDKGGQPGKGSQAGRVPPTDKSAPVNKDTRR